MNSSARLWPGHMADLVLAAVPDRLAPEARDYLVRHLEPEQANLPLFDEPQFGSLATLIAVGYGLGEFTLYVPTADPYDPPKPDAITDRLLGVFADVAAELRDKAPVPPNAFLVGVRGDDLSVGMPVAGRVSKGSALNLAVWLVALADPQLTRFAPMLAKVLST